MRNQDTLDRLTHEITSNCGDWLAAVRAVGVSLQFVNQWRKDDPETHNQLLEAERAGTQGLVSAAIQRAVHGVTRDVYYKGEVVGEQKEYSDTLLTTLLKARVPEFKTDAAATPSVVVNVANLMPRAASYEEWLAMKEQTLALPGPSTPLPSTSEDMAVIDATFTATPEREPVLADAADWIKAVMSPSDDQPFKGLDL